MAVLLLIILILCAATTFVIDKKSLLSPRFLLCIAIIISYCLVLCNYRNWDVSINGKFVLFVSTAVVAWIIGGSLVKLIYRIYERNGVCVENRIIPLRLDKASKKYPVNILYIVSVVLALIYIYKMLYDSSGATFWDRLRYIYDNIVNNDYSPGFIFNQMLEVVIAIAYVNTFRLLRRFFSKDDKISIIKLIVPIIMFLFAILITTDRNRLLRYAIYAVCLYGLFFIEKKRYKYVNFALLLRFAGMFAVIVLAFFIMGLAKKYTSNFMQSISIYGGSGLYNFNLWLAGGNVSSAEGGETFATFLRSFCTIMNKIGIHIDIDIANRFDSFITFTSSTGYEYSSNIYSALKPFVADFGYFGVVFFPFILGILYQWLYIKANTDKFGFLWILYCMLIYPVFYFPILEQLFVCLSLGFVYEFVWLAVMFYCAYGRHMYKVVGIKKSSKETVCKSVR